MKSKKSPSKPNQPPFTVVEPDISKYVPKAHFPRMLNKSKNEGQYGDILEILNMCMLIFLSLQLRSLYCKKEN